MARYNTFKYNEQKYGTTPTNPNLFWTFIVKWDGTYYSNFNEATRMVDLTVTRGRDHLVKADGNGWERYRPGTATIILDNRDGRYDPYNTSSPLYPNVTPGKFCWLKVKDGTDGLNYSIMKGKIDDIQPYNRNGERFVSITVVDGLQYLASTNIRYGLHQNVIVKSTISGLLNMIEWPNKTQPEEWHYAATGNGQNLKYFWGWNKNTLETINDLLDYEVGQLVHDRNGELTFFHGQFTHLESVTIDQNQLLRDITIPQPWEVVRNRVLISCNTKQLFPVNTEIWNLGDKPLLQPSQTIWVEANFRYDGQVVCAVSETVNATFNSVADGSGTNYGNAQYTKAAEVSEGALLSFTNQFNVPAYLIGRASTNEPARIVGNVIYAKNKSSFLADNTNNQSLYGLRVFELNNWIMQTSNYAQSYANWLLSQLKDPKKFPTIQIENRPTLQFAYDLYRARITLNAPTLGIVSENYRIGKIEHKWLNENGQAVRTTWKLEPYLTPFTP